MSIRLNKICREYNIGIQTIVDYLSSTSYPIDMPSPNYKLSDIQYDLVARRFGGTRLITIPWREDSFTENPKENRDIINSHGWNRLRGDTVIVMPERCILIPKNQSCESLDFWTEAEIKENNVMDGGRIIKERLPQPTGTIPVLPDNNSADTVEKTASSKEPFRIEKQQTFSSPSVIGNIDLSKLNAATRPTKKNKEEGRKIREEKRNRNTGPKISTTQQHSNQLQIQIRDIWQHFVDIQEKLIKQRCSPISIIPESIEIDNDKLYVTVDESKNERQLDSIFKDKLGLDSYDLESDHILVDDNIWETLSEDDLNTIRKGLAECYVELDTTPTINATINYGGNMERSDQLSTVELHQLDAMLKDGTLIEGTIENTAAFISKVSVLREEYINYLFGSHYVVYEKKKKNQQDVKLIEQLEYYNEYIPWGVIQQYAHLGLNCKSYKLIFKVKNQRANELLKNSYDCYFPNTDTFEFCRSFTSKDPCHEDYATEANDNIRIFMDEALIYCSRDDIEINVLFTYSISKHQIVKAKFQEVALYIRNKGEGYSFNEETGAIGVDFNWREESIEDIIADIEHNVPFIKINVHDEHRFKCKVHSQLVGYELLKSTLEDKYEDIDISNDCVFHQIKIKLPYIDAEYFDVKRANLRNDLQQFIIAGTDVELSDRIDGKIRLNLHYNKESRLEDLAESIADMRKADFGFMLEDKEFAFGKLLRANYPELIFDIDVADDKKDKVIEAFESKAITTIVPILTGDLEKIHRLKDTFTKATTGAELVNPNLQRFIFNSAEATPTSDIDLMLRRDGTVYREICEHLLNKNVNESQKDAIIKAMYADDLAVIQGPPGTGKSTAIAELIWQLVRKGLEYGNERERILLTSETNLAVDNAISRIVNNKTNLVKPIRFGGEEKLESEGLQFSIELMKRWVEEGDACLQDTETDEETDSISQNNLILKNWLSNISSRAFYGIHEDDNDIILKWRSYLEQPSKTLREIVYNRYIENVNVIGATCSSIGDKRAGNNDFNGFTQFYHNFCEVFKQKKGRASIKFTTVIQDESSKATPAELVLPFVYGKRAIVIGDHRQLPPMLDKEEFEDTLDYAYRVAKDDEEREDLVKLKSFVEDNFGEMEVSHFQRLYENIDSSLKATFNLQYRMHPDINEVIEQFYREDGGLKCGLTTPRDLGVNTPNVNNPASRYHGIDIPGLITPNTHVLFIETSTPEMMDGTSRVNYGEIDVIDKLISRFEHSDSFLQYLSKFSKEEDKQIGIISFYGKQIKQLRAMAHEHPSIPIRVSTVDRFQGMERNIVIVSMVRSNVIQSSKNQQPDKKRYPNYGYPIQKSLGFAQSPNRLNVALSRAKRLLIIVGNRELFSKLDIYQRLFLTINMNSNNKVVKHEEV